MNTRYKVIISLGLAALLAAGCNQTSQQPPPPAATPGQNVVIYTDSGFSPGTLTIKQGQTVTFENQSSSGMSVASNPHPTHTDYPEFDQYKSSQRGQQTYTFTFEKVGRWGFHNHLNPSSGGTIIVQ